MTDDDAPDWSEPHRADTGDGVDLDDIKDARNSIDDTMTDTDDLGGEGAIMIPDRTCDECAHVQVCALVAGFRPMLESWSAGEGPDSDAPLDVLDMAKICPEYIPAEKVEEYRAGPL